MKKPIGPTQGTAVPYEDRGSRACLDCDTNWIGPAPCFICDTIGIRSVDLTPEMIKLHALTSASSMRF